MATPPENISVLNTFSVPGTSMAKYSTNLVFNINLLPEEVLIEIFKYLDQNELVRISRVCKRWNAYAWSPALWKKIDVDFFPFIIFENEKASFFFKKLSSSVIQMKLDFEDCYWKEKLNFESFCMTMNHRCPHLHTLILHFALFSVTLPTVIDLCSEFLPNLKVLILESVFGDESKEREYQGFSKIEILDVSHCGNVKMCLLSKMPYLKKLNFSGLNMTHWFWEEETVPFLHQLELLHVGNTNIGPRTYRILQNHATNLIELFLCHTYLNDNDFSFNNSVFAHLKTICLVDCDVTCEGIIYLLQSHPLLQTIYVDRDVAETFVKHPFVTTNISELGIVKGIDDCNSHKKLDYLLD